VTRPIAFLIAAVAACSVCAADPTVPRDSTDARLLEKLLGEESPPPATDALAAAQPPANVDDSPAAEAAIDPTALETITQSLRDAEQRLAAKQTGEPTQAAQRKAIDEFNRLIESAKRQASKAPRRENSGSSQQPMDGEATPEPTPGEQSASPASTGDQPAGQARRNRDAKAEESSDRPQESRPPTDRIGAYRSGLAREAWGHLPQRLREQLLNAGSDRVLPQYDATIRRYFESLAQPEKPSPPMR
jgi:hypothetical protein